MASPLDRLAQGGEEKREDGGDVVRHGRLQRLEMGFPCLLTEGQTQATLTRPGEGV